MTNHNHDRSSAWLIIIMIDLLMPNQIKSSVFMPCPESGTHTWGACGMAVRVHGDVVEISLHGAIDSSMMAACVPQCVTRSDRRPAWLHVSPGERSSWTCLVWYEGMRRGAHGGRGHEQWASE